MSAVTDLLIEALNGNAVLALILVGLFALNSWQTKHFDKRFGSVDNRMQSVEKRIIRAENHLINETEPYTDGGTPEPDPEYSATNDDDEDPSTKG